MIIKYEDAGDQVIINLPNNVYWEIRYRMFSDLNDDYHKLCLIVGEKELTIFDAYKWCQGRKNMFSDVVGELYEEIVESIAERLSQEPDLKYLDISAIESELVETKYFKLWLEKGYIEVDANGRW